MKKIRVFHGTSVESAINIIRNGPKIISAGYFGRAFYVTDDPLLAFHNYAWGNQGAVLSFDMDTSSFLDLRNPEDSSRWNKHMSGRDIGDPSIDEQCRRAGINGLFDNSVGGYAIYKPSTLTLVGPLPENISQARPKVPKNIYVGGTFVDREGFFTAEPNTDKAFQISGRERFKDVRAGIERWVSPHAIRYLTRNESNEIVGMLRVVIDPHKKKILSNIWVDEQCRGQGVARTMETLAMIDHPRLELDAHLTVDGGRYFKAETAPSLQI